jgi:hypothetical protein
MTTTNKWLLISESRGDSSRCTPYRGKPDQHAPHFSRLIRLWSRTIHPTWSTYATFRGSPRGRNMPLHPKKVLTTKDRLAQSSSWVASFFLTCDSPEVGERHFGPVVTQLLQLTGPINISMRSICSILARGTQPIGS